jgi:hypothetical protein
MTSGQAQLDEHVTDVPNQSTAQYVRQPASSAAAAIEQTIT